MTLSVDELVRQTGERFGDWRTTIFDVQVTTDGDRVVLGGTVLEPAQRAALRAALQSAFPSQTLVDELRVCTEAPGYHWALVSWAVLNLRREPAHTAELITQTTLGEALEVLREQGDWSLVRMRDGYLGWVQSNALLPYEREQALAYREGATHVVAIPFAPCYDQQGVQTFLLPFGIPVCVEEGPGEMAALLMPGEAACHVDLSSLVPREACPLPDRDGVRALLLLLRQFVGVPYLWGGSTPFGFDCSGLVQTAYRFMGVALPRDADMQALTGASVDLRDISPGDLLFFSGQTQEAEREGHVSHVGIALPDKTLIHANQRNWAVTVERYGAGVAERYPGLEERLVAVRRHWRS